MGNITNMAVRGELLSGKTPSSAVPPPRKLRPLGDITNIKPAIKPPAPKQGARDSRAAAHPAPKSALDLQAEIFAKEGTENLAGKGWKQLQAEAARREDQAIAARVAAIVSIPYHFPMASLSEVRALL